MKKVFIVHGFLSQPNYGWQTWLMNKMEEINVYACALPMPTPDKPILNQWIETIEKVCSEPSDEIYLIGHSLGCQAILHFLEKTSSSVSSVFLVAPPFEKINPEDMFSKLRATDNFYTILDNQKIISSVKKITIIHARNDQKVPYEHAEKLAHFLSCELLTLEEGGHLGRREGVSELPILLDSLKKELV